MKDLKQSNEQIIEVTFDYKLEEQFIQKLPNLKTYKNNFDNTWYLIFDSLEDMRPIIFDFAQENGLKILELSSKNQRLETLFTELTA
jgi:ABC-2 type transport system ATP-binding protein